MVLDEFFMRMMVNHTRPASLLGRTFNGFAKKINLLCLQGFFPLGIAEKHLVTSSLNGNVMYWFYNPEMARMTQDAIGGYKPYRLPWLTVEIILVE